MILVPVCRCVLMSDLKTLLHEEIQKQNLNLNHVN